MFLLTGDFNLSKTIWSNNDEVLCNFVNASNIEIQSSTMLLNSFNYLNLFQNNNIFNKNNKVLDLILTNEQNSVVLKSNCPMVECDQYHPALDIYIPIKSKNSFLNAKEVRYNFDSADYMSIGDELLSYDWFTFFNLNSLDNSIAHFYNKIYDIF